MKKLVVFALLLVAFACTYGFKNESNPLFALAGVEKVCFVSDQKFENAESVNCGDLIFNFCTSEQAEQNLKEFCQNCQGIQFYFSKTSAQQVLQKLKATVVDKTTIDGLEVTVAYTPYFWNCVFVKNKKVNLQLAEKDGRLIAGMPAILTGF